jgi:Family of unknown function (DUF5999)
MLSARQLSSRLMEGKMCEHQPRCPDWLALNRVAAGVVSSQPAQGWSLLCNGVVLFDDGGQLLPDGRAVPTPWLAAASLVPALAA